MTDIKNGMRSISSRPDCVGQDRSGPRHCEATDATAAGSMSGSTASRGGRPFRQRCTDFLKALDRGRRVSLSLKDPTPDSAADAAARVDKAIKALEAVGLTDFLVELRQERERLVDQVESDLQHRRELLRRQAKGDGWMAQGFADYDRVGCFRVSYKRERVTVHVGSERLAAFVETDGRALFRRLCDLLTQLEEFPFTRASFFGSVKDGIAMGRALGKAREGKVPVRILHTLVVLCRQHQDGRFLKDPSSKRFRDYPIAQFAYDLARFGQESWSEGDERLVNLPPNMATAAKGATLSIPALQGGSEHQLGAIGVQRR